MSDPIASSESLTDPRGVPFTTDLSFTPTEAAAPAPADLVPLSLGEISGQQVASNSDDFTGGPIPYAEIWECGLSEIGKGLDRQVYAAYLEPLKLTQFIAARCLFVVTAPSKLVKTYVENNFIEKLDGYLSSALSDSTASVRIDVASDVDPELLRNRPRNSVVIRRVKASVAPTSAMSGHLVPTGYPQRNASPSAQHYSTPSAQHYSPPSAQAYTAPAFSDAAAISKTQAPSPLDAIFRPNPRYTFSSFVVGNSNQFCHAAALRVAERPGLSYNPLFIYGGVGLGKTHLLHAIGNEVLQRNPASRVLYMSSETFTNELILALRHAKMEEFKNRLRAIEVLLIDDIQFMCGKERTQEEFFHTFNALYSAKHQIVITSDKIPQEISGLEERLQTRFSWGLTADLQAPDFETRVAIINRKAAHDAVELDPEVASYISENVVSNVRELEGALTRIQAMSSIQRMPMNIELARLALRHLLQPKQVTVTVDDIKGAVADQFAIRVSEMISKRRTKNLSFPRHIAMYLCRKHTTLSYIEIGSCFGGRDHSSVIHASNVVASKVGSDNEVKKIVHEIERRLAGK